MEGKLRDFSFSVLELKTYISYYNCFKNVFQFVQNCFTTIALKCLSICLKLLYDQRFFTHTPLFLSLSKTGLLPANIILHGICIPIPLPLFTTFPVIPTVAEFIVSVRRKQEIRKPRFFE